MYKMLFNFTIIIKVPIVVQIKGNIKISNSTLQVKKNKENKDLIYQGVRLLGATSTNSISRSVFDVCPTPFLLPYKH